MIPIVSAIEKESIKTTAEKVGIVFPLQGPTFPVAVKRFLERIDLTDVKYIFAVATRGGTTCRIHREIDRILKRRGRSLDAHFIITVFNNDPKFKSGKKSYYCHPLSPEEITRKTEEIHHICDEISQIVESNLISHRKDTDYIFKYGFLLEKIIVAVINKQEKKAIRNYFYADTNCIGCGLCEKVCLSSRISINGGKPVWDDNKICYMCYACLNFCPLSSVQIHSNWFMKSYTATEKRYDHPYAIAEDIINQKKI